MLYLVTSGWNTIALYPQHSVAVQRTEGDKLFYSLPMTSLELVIYHLALPLIWLLSLVSKRAEELADQVKAGAWTLWKLKPPPLRETTPMPPPVHTPLRESAQWLESHYGPDIKAIMKRLDFTPGLVSDEQMEAWVEGLAAIPVGPLQRELIAETVAEIFKAGYNVRR